MSDGLSREQIVRAAVDLLDADGPDGLSMRKLGTRLGAGATSMYWHVGNKDNLVALAADAVFGEIAVPGPDDAGWRDALMAAGRGVRAAIARHPWLVGVLSTRTDLNGPQIAAFQARTLDACAAAGFTGDDLDHASNVIFAFVLGSSVGEVGSTARPLRPGSTGSTADADLMADARRWAEPYPALLARYDALGAADPDAVRDASFDFGLGTVLDGLALRAPAARDTAPD